MAATPEACVGVSGPLLMVGTAPPFEAVSPWPLLSPGAAKSARENQDGPASEVCEIRWATDSR